MTMRPALKDVLAQNTKRLREARHLSQPDVHKAAKRAGYKVGQTTVSRVEKSTARAWIDTIEALAAGIGVEPWQLLVVGLDPAAPPTLSGESSLTAAERVLIAQYRQCSGRWRLAMTLIGSISVEDEQDEIAEGLNILMAKIFAPAVPDARVAEAYGLPNKPTARTLQQSGPADGSPKD